MSEEADGDGIELIERQTHYAVSLEDGKLPDPTTTRRRSSLSQATTGTRAQGEPKPPKTSGTVPSTINVINSMIGAGILGLPFAVEKTGLLLGLLLLVMFASLAYSGAHLLMRSTAILVTTRNCHVTSYEELAQAAMGMAGRLIYNATCFVINFGSCSSYLIVLGDVLPTVLQSWTSSGSSWEPLVHRQHLLPILVVTIIFPLCAMKDISSLAFTSAISVAIYCALVVLVLIHSFSHANLTGVENHLWKVNSELFVALPILCFAYAFHTTLFPIFAELTSPRTPSRMLWIVRIALGTTLLVYLTVGTSGFLLYRSDTRGDLLINFENEPSLMFEVLRALFAVSVIFTFPIIHFPARESLHSLIHDIRCCHRARKLATIRDSEPAAAAPGTRLPHHRIRVFVPRSSTCQRLLETCALVGGALLIALAITEVERVLAFVGAVGGAMVTYILPAVLYLMLNPKFSRKEFWRMPGPILLAVSGVIFAVLSVYHLTTSTGSETVAEGGAP